MYIYVFDKYYLFKIRISLFTPRTIETNILSNKFFFYDKGFILAYLEFSKTITSNFFIHPINEKKTSLFYTSLRMLWLWNSEKQWFVEKLMFIINPPCSRHLNVFILFNVHFISFLYVVGQTSSLKCTFFKRSNNNMILWR